MGELRIFSFLKMRIFIFSVLIVFASSAGGNQGQKNARKTRRKEFRQCKREQCAQSCPEGEVKTDACFACLESSCNVPNRMNKMIDCMKESCTSNCTEDRNSESCQSCKQTNCNGKRARAKSGGAPRRQPLAIVDKYVCGRQAGCHDLQDGSKAQHRCALGMCYKKCILEPINELDCENCIRTLCPRASDNYSCVSAERDHKYFFCSNAENCTGPHSGAIQVNEKSCPSGAYCCSWGE